MIVAYAEVHPEIVNGREVVLHVSACLSALSASTEGRKDVWVAAAIEEETL
jgi:hypothetical protein